MPAPRSIGALVVPGYHFLKCHAQSPFADLWSATGPDGSTRRALSLSGTVCTDPELPSRMQALMHPALPPTEVFHNPDGRLVLTTEPLGKTLRDRFLQCRAEGKVGIPRQELLEALGQAAEVLDLLAEDLGLAHMGLNPSNVFFRGGRVQIADFGLLALAAGPEGMKVGPFNSRYAAPELTQAGSGPGSPVDQFALALIYAEMLIGLAPRPLARGSSRIARTAGGAHGSHSPRQQPRATRFDLDLLPSHDRPILARALREAPRRRYRNCTELIRGLREATPGRKKTVNPYAKLPPVISVRTLFGEPSSQGSLPTSRQFIESLALQTPHLEAAAEPGPLPGPPLGGCSETLQGPGKGPNGTGFQLGREGIWEAVLPVVLPPGALALKVRAFQRHWDAHVLGQDEEGYRLQIELRKMDSTQGRADSLEVELRLRCRPHAPDPATPHLCEVHVSLRPREKETEGAMELLRQKGNVLLGSLALCLQANPEQRGETRFPCRATLMAYPVLADLTLGEALKGTGKDLSLSGISFQTPSSSIPSDKIYLHWPHLRAGRDFAILASVVRIATQPDGVEVGAYFPGSRTAVAD